MSGDVFIGYSSKDLKHAETIQAHLKSAGISCFLDKTDIRDYAKWTNVVPAAIRDCQVYLALISDNSLASEWVGNELAFATKYKKPRLPVILTPGMKLPDDLDIQLGTIQHIEADPSLEAVLPRIAAATAQIVDRQKHEKEWAARDDVLNRKSYNNRIDCAVNGYGLANYTISNGTGRIDGSSYVLTSVPGEYLGAHMEHLPVTSEFVLEANLRHCAGPADQWFGIEFGQSFPGNYCQFLLNGSGGAHIAKHLNLKWSQLFTRASLSFVHSSGDVNHLVVVRHESTFHLFVNKRHVASIEDFDIRAGTPGVMVGQGIGVEFSDMRVAGVSLEARCDEALKFWREKKPEKAKEILDYLARYDPGFHAYGLIGALRRSRF